MEPQNNNSVYWALEPTENVGNVLMEKVREYYKFLEQSGRMDLYRKMYLMYYGPAIKGATLQFTGEQGELIEISVNDLRNLLTHLKTLITSQAPAFDVRASNTDHKSLAQTILGKGLVDYYLREKELEDYMDDGVEMALVYAEAFITTPWNATLGKVFDAHPDTEAPIREGDIDYSVYAPYDYVRDFSLKDHRDCKWGITVDWVNKYELAAKYPDFHETIINLDASYDLGDGCQNFREQRRFLYGQAENDTIPLMTFHHEPSDALPDGREVMFLVDGTVLYDEASPYEKVPARRIAAGKWLGTIFGYTTGYDLMPIEEMTNSLHSTICSNQNAFGVQNIWTKKGMGIDTHELAGGLRHIECMEKPEPLQLTATAPETFEYLKGLGVVKETISAINSVARGNPEREMSGTAMALLQTTAIMFSQSLQKSYIRCFEGVTTDTLLRLKAFAKTPRVAAITGVMDQKYLEEFTADDLNLVDRVLVDMGSPFMNTAAGRLEMAKYYTEQGWITDHQQFMMMATTGQMKLLYEGQQSEMMLIRAENEQLMKGINPPVMITDNILRHLEEHKVVLNSPEARKNPKIALSTTNHMNEHLKLWRGYIDEVTGQMVPGIDPDLAALLGLPPPPMMAPPGMTPNPQGLLPDQGSGAPNTPAPNAPGQEAPVEPGGSVLGTQGPDGTDTPSLPPGSHPMAQNAAGNA